MSIPGAASTLFLATTAGAAEALEISRSLRFNQADTAYLNRTPGSAGNRRTYTLSFWVKKCDISDEGFVFSASSSVGANGRDGVRFENGDNFRVFFNGASSGDLITTALFRDPSAWYHFVVAVDTTQSTASDRVKIYQNGSQITAFSTATYPSQNYQSDICSNVVHRIGSDTRNTSNNLDAYLAEVNFIDGAALGPSSFGQADANGVWQAIDTAGLTFGTNGFRLKFADNSSDAALGTDSSGNSNTWTVNNITASSVLYSANTTSTGAANSPTTAFDGATGPRWSLTCESTSNFLGVTFNPPLVGQLSVVSYSSNASTFQYEVNGSNVGTPHTGYSSLTEDNLGTYTSITSFKYKVATTSGGTQGGFSQLKLNGTVLVDGNPANIDSLVDSPSNGTQTDTGVGNEVVGNYCTLNPLSQLSGTLSNGNLDYNLGSGTKFVSGTIAVKSGKYYWEAKAVSGTTNGSVGGRFGFSQSSSILHGENGPFTLTWHATSGIQVFTSGSYSTLLTGTNYADGDTLGCALDADSNIAYFYKNGSLAYTYNFSSYISAGSQFLTPTCWNGSSGTPVWTYNFGARAFAHSARTNHKCLCTANLPTPTIADGSKYFDTKLYTGNGGTQAITNYNFSPDWVWIKSRSSSSYGHMLFDAVRGAANSLFSQSTSAEGTPNAYGKLNSFNSNGFTVAPGSSDSTNVNANNATYVGWAWDAGTSTVTNNDGSIASQVRAQPSAGFSIVSFTASGSAGSDSCGHGLNAVPGMVIIKRRDASDNWLTWHSSFSNAQRNYILLDSTAAITLSTNDSWGAGMTSSVIGFRSQGTAAGNMIAYCFAPVAGYSAMGSFEGNGNANGPFIYLGFKPALVILKLIEGVASSWKIYDNTRDPDNPIEKQLYPNSSNAEPSDDARCDFLSNGFKIRTAGSEDNYNNNTFIYYAVAENPFQANGGLAR